LEDCAVGWRFCRASDVSTERGVAMKKMKKAVARKTGPVRMTSGSAVYQRLTD
jgi:hypothetical protein